MPVRRLLSAVAVVATVSAFSTAPAVAASANVTAPSVRNLVGTVLDNYAGNNNKPTQRYYADGVWFNTDNSQNWAQTEGGAALAAASLWASTGRTNSALLRKAVDTIDVAIATGQNADGSFSAPPAAAVGPSGAGVTTEFFARMFGDTYLLVQSTLTTAQRQAWVAALTRAGDFLITNKDVTFYANGNVNLGYAQTLYLAWRASGATRFATAYDAEWSFLLNPDQARWPGFGLHLTRTPVRPDGADGAGYLAEKGIAPDPGFDAEYTMVSLSEASDLHVVSRDPRALRLANLLMNVLRPRLSSTMQLDTSGGARHAELNRSVAFTSSAPAILSWLGGRDDLASMVPDYVNAVSSTFMQSLPWASNPVYYGSLGVEVAGMLRVTATGYAGLPPVVSPAGTSPSPPGMARDAASAVESPRAAVAPATNAKKATKKAKKKTKKKATRSRAGKARGTARRKRTAARRRSSSAHARSRAAGPRTHRG
jgi:hypothetical protein